MKIEGPTLAQVVVKTVVAHSITYFVVGVLAALTLKYPALYSDPAVAAYTRPFTDRMVMAGPLFQPIRGLLLGLLFYLLREPFFQRRRGWLTMWVTLLVVGIFSPFLGGPGSIEALIYSRLPLSFQLISIPEVVIQSFLLSALVFHWVNHPRKSLNWLLGIMFLLIMLFPALGLLAGAQS
jgi:hypothetical protein